MTPCSHHRNVDFSGHGARKTDSIVGLGVVRVRSLDRHLMNLAEQASVAPRPSGNLHDGNVSTGTKRLDYNQSKIRYVSELNCYLATRSALSQGTSENDGKDT